MSGLAEAALSVAAWAFPAFLLLALGLLWRGSRAHGERSAPARRRAFALTLVSIAGLVTTGWPFCERILWPFLAALT
jgi:hypothetical protein